jgi:hypothetical protein
MQSKFYQDSTITEPRGGLQKHQEHQKDTNLTGRKTGQVKEGQRSQLPAEDQGSEQKPDQIFIGGCHPKTKRSKLSCLSDFALDFR